MNNAQWYYKYKRVFDKSFSKTFDDRRFIY
jgi:hypothetical protein